MVVLLVVSFEPSFMKIDSEVMTVFCDQIIVRPLTNDLK